MRRHKPTLFSILILALFGVGIAFMLYPSVSNAIYQVRFRRLSAELALESQETNKQLWDAADDYNTKLASTGTAPDNAYEYLNPLGNGLLGFISIDKIGVYLPIYQGTTERQLQSGCGWWVGTSLPTGEPSTHCVITAHSGLVKAKMFTDLEKLQLGDTFELQILDRNMVYEVDQILTTTPDDTSPLAVQEGKDYVTLYTCTPYGVNTHRLLVRGHRVYQPEVQSEENTTIWHWIIFLACVAAFPLVALGYTRINSHRRGA